jgi:two-component system phosphate regulon sensor histidine kinase PhoR
VDRVRSAAALEYLLDNAIKYNRPGGRVDVEVSADDATVAVQITDTGVGQFHHRL